ncbi:MAG TPA: pentapeptide repeat-containing protein [Saprospiraceae bacterium]|nr:pentapeptide repeat-containing protein [Saprospiraceae bacterium]
MKANRNLLLGLVLGALIVGTIVFLCMPFIIKNTSFLPGFIVSLIFASFVLILVLVWNQNSLLIRLLEKQSATDDYRNASRTHAYRWLFVAIVIVLGLVSGFLIFRQNVLFNIQTQNQRTRIAQQSELIESVRKSSLIYLMANILDKIDDELKHDRNRKLSDATIARIAALSYSLKPYTSFEGDSMSKQKLSPERGQLLLALSKMNIDSVSLHSIMLQATFAAADLSGADLREADLKWTDLRGADLQDATLQAVNLHEADLMTANLWGADLSKADMTGVNLRRADLRWADLSEANLHKAILNGALFTSAQLRKTDLRESSLEWADLSGAFLNEVNLSGANMTGASLIKTHLIESDLSEANLHAANLSEAILTGADLTGASLIHVIVSEKNWFVQLDTWEVKGGKEILATYQIVDKSSKDQPRYILEKKGE